MGFIRDCFTGKDSCVARSRQKPEHGDGLTVLGTVIVVGGITFVMTIIHPALGLFVLVSGTLLGMFLSAGDGHDD